MTHNIIYTPRKTSLSETGSRSLTSELSVQRPEGASYGGSQTWFSSPSIRGYGCGLIAAHDPAVVSGTERISDSTDGPSSFRRTARQ